MDRRREGRRKAGMKVRQGLPAEEKREGAKVRRQMREGNRRRTGGKGGSEGDVRRAGRRAELGGSCR